jgi:transglutaminase-like putative cysteine protease
VKYRVTHRTRYTGADSVSVGHNQAWLEFRPADRQQIESFSLQITPEPSVRSRRSDAFGNPVQLFSFNEGYQQLEITATTTVAVREPCLPEFVLRTRVAELRERLQRKAVLADRAALEFLFPSPKVAWTHTIRQWAAETLAPEQTLPEAVLALTARIHQEFTYDSRATTVNTPVPDVFRIRRGVCQDFAHLQIATLRSVGLPARYVSGYLRTIPPPGQPRLVGADASHAWCAVYAGNGEWIDCDPTNNTLCSTDHLTLAWGRDYSDVPPVTGVCVGGSQHRLSVSVDVLPLEQ